MSAIEDREIEGVIRKQEMIGLKSATDGEYRRISWNYDFLERLDNVESYVGDRRPRDRGRDPQAGDDRAEIGDRRRVPAYLLELRLSGAARQRRILCRRAQNKICRQRPAAAADPAARHRQARRL